MGDPAPPRHPTSERDRLRRSLSRTMLRTVGRYDLIEEGDRILVAVSGGKDSATLLDLLLGARRKSPVRYELVACHLDQGQPGHDPAPLRAWLERLDVPFEIHREETFPIARKMVAGSGAILCSACSRLRRGVLYSRAEAWSCNKIALAHHRDDALQTLLLNLMFAGRIQAMPAAYTTGDGRFRVLRPLVECAESEIRLHCELAGYPILPCRLCGADRDPKRERVARLLDELEAEHPDLRQVMLSALRNVRPTHLLDREVEEAWSELSHRYPPRR